MPRFLQATVLAAVLGVLLLVVLGPGWAFPGAQAPSRTERVRLPSPSGEHVAIVVEVSGGGAAGFFHDEVRLRRRSGGEDHLVATRLRGVRLAWLADHRLRVDFAAGEPGLLQVDGITVGYLGGQ